MSEKRFPEFVLNDQLLDIQFNPSTHGHHLLKSGSLQNVLVVKIFSHQPGDSGVCR